ncbi:mevalonate kinase [uncultured Clostridium sp.]|uniref:GHMP family kinase ATP-binding protein n=1 Tax=uncultured Clostridium sp. TaxID=59620 RepID=UPI0008212CCD|nr:kinase [uncultured Clostridium sp.]SCK03882.1 mevalonate kinase [uncultured Clostridium sp.]
MKVIERYPGSVGEIIQGKYNGIDVLLSCPINLYTEIILSDERERDNEREYIKSYRFIDNILDEWGYKNGKIALSINSKIPKGKGFASSTADLSAIYNGLLRLASKEFNKEELIKHCLKIEPTDSIIFDKATIFDYKEGKVKEKVNSYFKFYVLCFVGENVVDTVEYNKKELEPLKNIDDLIIELREAFKNRDTKKLAKISTESIIRNQHRLKYNILEAVLEINNLIGGLGIIGAHSGDMLGIIFDNIDEEKMKRIENININGYEKIIVETLDSVVR